MLSMFGIIKHELKKQGKLPAKYDEDYRNKLYDDNGNLFNGSILQTDSDLGPRSFYYLFNPASAKLPFDPFEKDWEFSCQLNLKNTTSTQVLLNLATSETNIVSSKSWHSDYQFVEHITDKGESYRSYNAGSTSANSKNYIKLTYTKATSIFTGYYSKDGTSWTKIQFKEYSGEFDNQHFMFTISQNLDSSVPVNSIKFIYDGKILFG